ncbi:beta-1,4-mannosyltransferase egh [Anopheles arabiensis]|uniref:beta-1,4-mannosyltransferase egh n=1 Tax=Anopheles arabiensis TaxID=7173 RepID=UPI001AAD5DA8|nr:beta-1,4-mannosyltransferase egh [Anopheles arabiensis]XP_040172417.1 beta-1,4-mannosyltransferase egh [Anopheles arabiensis]XP_040172418.1 beta-1,4-mannosyltransferase egh [Anopheles arabiensis]XP_040172419.1 beta-1,4-mannosyltransferase egh [Anopheles arabiensis]XP_040172420.1 beta-1,4-mannosyltransferase egh [Anopheles arabiensis]XP_040172422.1 beta-1,4-mannosyltransferase egh [Anopheles arabiensis]XP_040172423.1 beta-1,4-mannosyltransferase egh [Anopheles arabiensis]
MLNSTSKHIMHCALLFGLLIVFEIFCGGIKVTESAFVAIDPWEEYGTLLTIVLYLLRLLTFLTLPQVLFNFFGLVIYNAFPEKVVLKGSPLLAPFICIRIVTRGDYAELVKTNVLRNMNTCLDTGLENFLIEVVTDKPIGLPKHRRTREIVVPKEYKTKTGAMFKARALQYCLEDTVNVLNNNDWVVHLDEETLLTENSVRGIINFVLDGKHPFGQGLITYANENVVNWLTTLADSFRVSDDMGKLRLQFKMFHKPYFSWKGSYVVTQVHAEKAVSFDNGIDGSVAEDCFFAMRAFAQGYTFNFIEGEMYEKSPFTLTDFLQQRKRWLQGILLVVRSTEIPLRNKVLLGISLCSWITMPLSTSNMIFAAIYPIPCPNLIDFVCAFIAGFNIYMYVFGVIKSFSLYRFGLVKFLACVLGALCTIPINVVIENVAVIWGLVGKKNKFYVVQKDVRALVTV